MFVVGDIISCDDNRFECLCLHDSVLCFFFRPGLFGNEVGRVLGGGLAPGWLVSVFTI